MTVLQALYAHLAASPGVTALTVDRIYPVMSPQIDPSAELLPTLIFAMTSRKRDYSLSDGPTMETTSWSVLALAQTPDLAHELADAAIQALSGFTGNLGGTNGPTVYCTLIDAMDEEQLALEGLGGVRCDFQILVAL